MLSTRDHVVSECELSRAEPAWTDTGMVSDGGGEERKEAVSSGLQYHQSTATSTISPSCPALWGLFCLEISKHNSDNHVEYEVIKNRINNDLLTHELGVFKKIQNCVL